MTETNLLLQYEFAMNLLENHVTPTFVLDAKGKVIIWNQACEKLTGVKGDEVIGTKDHWKALYDQKRTCLADLVLSGDLENLDHLYEDHAETSNISQQGLSAENWCTMPRLKKQLYLAFDVGPIYNQRGEMMAVVETLRDMTEYKKALIALQETAALDALTGIANRPYFEGRLAVEWARSQRQYEAVGLIMISVDYFKEYSEGYGHLIAEHCLKKITEALKVSVKRGTELVARYDEDVFCVLLPDTDLDGTFVVAERIRSHVQELALTHEYNPVSDKVTLSCGVAAIIPVAADDSAILVSAAEEALDEAQAKGRDQTVRFHRPD